MRIVNVAEVFKYLVKRTLIILSASAAVATIAVSTVYYLRSYFPLLAILLIADVCNTYCGVSDLHYEAPLTFASVSV